MEKKDDKATETEDKKKSKTSPKKKEIQQIEEIVGKFLSSNDMRTKIKKIANKIKKGEKKEKQEIYNIIYTVDPQKDFDEYYSDDDEYYSDEEEEEDEEDEEDEEEEEEEERVWNDSDILSFLSHHQSKDPNNKTLETFIDICNSKIQKKEETTKNKTKKAKDKNLKTFKELLKNKKEDELTFFNNLIVEEQEKQIEELKKINENTIIKKPYKISIIESSLHPTVKSIALQKVDSLRWIDPSSGEYHKLQNWVEGFMNIPFNIYKTIGVSSEDNECLNFMEKSQTILNSCVYGLNDAKMQIMQMVGQFISNPDSLGNAIAIKGPMGTGKTTLVKEGISKIFNRPFAFVSLGGSCDGSYLEGHSFTYEGSSWGKIVQILIQSKCMNPVIFFDELDKVSDTPKGEEIIGILTHLTDTTQNSHFHDKFFSEIDFDMSKCLFIFSYNDENKINPILRDRMYTISTKGYSKKEKVVIAKQHLLPTIYELVKFSPEDVLFEDSVLDYIIESRCKKEDGVRNFKRCLETIFTKINLYKMMKPQTDLFGEKTIEITFPFQVTKSVVDNLLKLNTTDDIFRGLYV
jgi:ATP-dependent Lon protease